MPRSGKQACKFSLRVGSEILGDYPVSEAGWQKLWDDSLKAERNPAHPQWASRRIHLKCGQRDLYMLQCDKYACRAPKVKFGEPDENVLAGTNTRRRRRRGRR